jgi:hypothetical protein
MMAGLSRRDALGILTALALALACAVAGAAGASAATLTAGWEASPAMYPSTLAPGERGYIEIPVYNVGAAPSSGSVTVTDELPAGLTAIEAGYLDFNELNNQYGQFWNCTLGSVVSCTNNPSVLSEIPPAEVVFLTILVEASAGASGTALNEATVSGGGALSSATATDPVVFGTQSPAFGFQTLDSWASNADGTLDTQAGSHPYSLTVAFTLNNTGKMPARAEPVGEARNVVVNAPPGVIGDPQAMPRCTPRELNAQACPPDTQIGVDVVFTGGGPGAAFPIEYGGGTSAAFHIPVYNMVPPPGMPAEFAFSIIGVSTRLDATVRSGSDYGISEHIKNIVQDQIIYNAVTIWGVPGEANHDYQRCSAWRGNNEECGFKSTIAPLPFLTLPTSCIGPQLYSGMTESWAPSGALVSGVSELSFYSHDDSGTPQSITGCDHLAFKPSIEIAPDTSSTDTPAGLTVDVKMPQEGLTDTDSLSMSNIKGTTVTLPEGVVINPGQAAGLAACQESQSAIGTEAAPSCPSASKVGTDQIETPLLANKLEGNVYVLQSNPPNLELLVAASGEGVNLKLVGHVHLDEATGRLTTTFSETPELPFTDFKLSFSGGAQAALSTPLRCGTYTATSDFTPWSTPQVQDAFPFSEFAVDHGPGGGACPGGTLPFTPSLTAGSTTDQAGGFTDFSLLLTREDDQQRISTLQFKTPTGLLGMISKVPLCPEAQANAGTCSEASQIGHTVVEAGPGPYPLVVPQPGQPPAPIYLTGGYKGAPYGLSIVVPLVVGPFTLQTQIVRAKIEVDPITTQLTITTDPLPTVIDGIPADLRTIDAVIDKQGFMFNPTNCSPQTFSRTATSVEGATAPISSHFQVGSCQSLKFSPDFKVSTSGKTSKAGGASLDAKIVYPTGPLGANQASQQSNIASVKVDLPKQLPSRLTTLQKACTAAQFDSNPAGCPKESMVGKATAITPVLPIPLTGPAYFVSHGGEAFPQLIVVLQGYGVTVDLVGDTFISKAGITSSTFKQVPDVPITSFDLSLPEGKYSALAANLPEQDHGNFCGQKLAMPTAFTAQNGAVISQSTPITVEGCSTALSFTQKVKQKTLTLTIYAPAAGKINATGKGLTSQNKTAKGQENITITLKQRHTGKRNTTVKVTFTPSTGKDRKKQSKSAKLRFKK